MSIDLVTMHNLLWTPSHPAQLLQKLRKILRPGSSLLIADGFWDHDLGEHAPSDTNWSHDRFIEVHCKLSLAEAHAVMDEIERKVDQTFPNAEIINHPEPAGIEDERLDDRLTGT